MCLGIADLKIQEKLRGVVWVRGMEVCWVDREMQGVERKEQARERPLGKKKKKFKEEENFLKETGKAKEDQKNLIAWPSASDAKQSLERHALVHVHPMEYLQ